MFAQASSYRIKVRKQNTSLRRFTCIVALLAILLAACGSQSSSEAVSGEVQGSQITVYKLASCGCCSKWTEYLEEHGYQVAVEEITNIVEIKEKFQVPSDLQSCHTAIIDGYVVEGHVPVAEINRLLAERPDVIGLAVPGMPPGSPGMEVTGVEFGTFDVFTFAVDGTREIFASYPQ